mgnify:CR=1 FL=1
MNYLIETANLSETSEIASLVNSAYRGETSKKGWTTEADLLDGQRTDASLLTKTINEKNKFILTLRKQNESEILACVCLEFFEDKCYLWMLTVKPTLQNSGIGKILISESENFARKHHIKRMSLGVIHQRIELISWYERRGYLKTDQVEDFPYDNPEFGIPKVNDLHFVMFEKIL